MDKSFGVDSSNELFCDIKNINTIDSSFIPGCIDVDSNSGNIGEFVNQQESLMEKNKDDCSVSVFDVASYILKKINQPISTMKLHKLLYYCQAWSMVWDEKPLFKERIEAWANGPVVRSLFNFHRGMYEISIDQLGLGDDRNLSTEQKETIDAVLDYYGKMTAQALINQTHFEKPWREARVGLEPDEPGNRVISLESMQSYYSSLS